MYDGYIDDTYLSVWANYPSTSFLSSGWTSYLQSVLGYYVTNLGIDGLLLDAPDEVC